jgi:hypothetical protein
VAKIVDEQAAIGGDESAAEEIPLSRLEGVRLVVKVFASVLEASLRD